MQVIQHVQLTATQSQIEFNSIPQTFTDLYVIFSCRGLNTGPLSPTIGINNLFSGYRTRWLQGNTSTVGTGVDPLGSEQAWIGTGPGGNGVANTFATVKIYLPNYRSGVAKAFTAQSAFPTGFNASSFHSQSVNTNSTTSAISSIQLRMGTGQNLVALSSATLYGITAGTTPGLTVT